MIFLLSLLVLSCSQGTVSRQGAGELSYDFLMDGGHHPKAVNLAAFSPAEHARKASNQFAGSLDLGVDQPGIRFRVLFDSIDLASGDESGLEALPLFDFDFIQSGDRLVPVDTGPVRGSRPWWEFVLSAGRVWDEPDDNGYSRAAIPFALKERNADCVHNGLMSFLFKGDKKVSRVWLQISSQTCHYLQFEMSGLLTARYVPGNPAGGAAAINAFQDNQTHRMPQRPIGQLSEEYPGTDPVEFGSVEEIDAQHMTLFGFVIDGIHYVGGCQTPHGEYPYCDELALPSYSTAKSFVAGLALMRAEKLYPGFKDALISDHVRECKEGWEGVTIEHALDSSTGHFGSAEPHADEDAAIVSRFFTGEDHATKIDYSCNEYSRRAEPGEIWVYQTWATYLAGTAINNRLKEASNPEADFYEDLLIDPIWQPLHLSRLAQRTRRTYDSVAQPFSGFGVTLYRDDVAKIAHLIGAMDGSLDGENLFDRDMFDAIKGRKENDPGLPAENDEIRYNNGFRTIDVTAELGCKNPTYLTTMSGYGGINIVLMPNDTAYYYFSDGNVHRYLTAVRESHRIRPMCQ